MFVVSVCAFTHGAEAIENLGVNSSEIAITSASD
jgi:hypothetical protein